MLEPIKPPDECERVGELHALCLLDTAPEERFDRITRTAQRLFGVATALVSLVDDERQWFKSARGLGATETARNISFCGHAILHDGAFIVADAAADWRFADNPLVTGPPHIRFYAGMPLHGPHGYRVGTLCIMDPAPRAFDALDAAALADLGMLVEAELNSRGLSQNVVLAKANEARLRAILDNVVEGIITIDQRGTIETVNPASVAIFGYAEDEVIGHNIKMLMPQPYQREHDGYLKNYCETGKAKVIGSGREVLGRRKDGSIFPLELAVSELQLGGRRVFSGIVRDITERKHAADALLAASRQLAATTGLQQAILNSANFSMIATGVDGIIKMFGAGAERMLGYAGADLIDLQTPAILHDPAEVAARAQALSAELGRPIEPGFETLMAQARAGRPDEMEWTYIRKDGGRLPVMLSVTAVKDEHGVLTGYLGIAYDLTERKKIEQMKNEFISTVSHELRTPLTSIRGSLGLLAAGSIGAIPQAAHVLLDIANNNCERLVRLINDILDIEKIESGNMPLNTVTQPILPLAQQAIESTEAYAAQHGVRFLLQPGAGSGNAYVMVDADRIIQVMVNLLSNAAKFSPEGADVKVILAQTPGWVRMAVIDQGPGIGEQFRAHIFKKFAQADSSDTRQKGGTGLGLSISKAIIEKHQGRIGFNPAPGAGTEFYFELPSLAVPAPQATGGQE
jgi:PAS domain S-box-containing protein